MGSHLVQDDLPNITSDDVLAQDQQDHRRHTDEDAGEKSTGVRVAEVLAPALDPKAELAIKDFQTFISFVLSISIFGASTFAVLVGQMQDPKDIWDKPQFSMQTVRTLLAIAWLFFVLAIGLAAYSSSVMTILRQRHDGTGPSWTRKWDNIGIAVSVALHFLIVGAFMSLSVALVAYVPVVGWVATGLTSAVGVFVIFLMMYQVNNRGF